MMRSFSTERFEQQNLTCQTQDYLLRRAELLDSEINYWLGGCEGALKGAVSTIAQ